MQSKLSLREPAIPCCGVAIGVAVDSGECETF